MKTFDELYTGIAALRKLVVQAENADIILPSEQGAHLDMLQDVQSALREYASLHLEMAPRILARGYIEAKS